MTFLRNRLFIRRINLIVVPDGANLGLDCGNPQAIGDLKPGDVVLDLGSGGGFDCFLASRQVEATGHVIGVNMTPKMVSRARNNALKRGFTNTDFRLEEIEHLPVPDQTVDVNSQVKKMRLIIKAHLFIWSMNRFVAELSFAQA